jgi:catechol 2,3-dioxygenase-like lactoylglutathione lyase family enzyme
MEFSALIPELSVSDITKSLAFYKALGFRVEYERPENKFAFLSLGEAQLMIQEGEGGWSTGKLEHPYGRGINFQIDVNDVTPLVAALKKAKLPLFEGVEDHWYRQGSVLLGCREFLVQDPDGYLLRFSQDIGEKRV